LEITCQKKSISAFTFVTGDSGGRHFKEPKDTSKLVSVANLVAGGLRRDLNWLHLTVPIDRKIRPITRLWQRSSLAAQTELYLGLIHFNDGIIGARKRIESQANTLSDLECPPSAGSVETTRKPLPELMRIHTAIEHAHRGMSAVYPRHLIHLAVRVPIFDPRTNSRSRGVGSEMYLESLSCIAPGPCGRAEDC